MTRLHQQHKKSHSEERNHIRKKKKIERDREMPSSVEHTKKTSPTGFGFAHVSQLRHYLLLLVSDVLCMFSVCFHAESRAKTGFPMNKICSIALIDAFVCITEGMRVHDIVSVYRVYTLHVTT